MFFKIFRSESKKKKRKENRCIEDHELRGFLKIMTNFAKIVLIF